MDKSRERRRSLRITAWGREAASRAQSFSVAQSLRDKRRSLRRSPD
jgi:hypothetical protein